MEGMLMSPETKGRNVSESLRGTVFTHRLRISRESELDPRLAKLICEAYETVGPGTKR
jgi:hypothetical protein